MMIRRLIFGVMLFSQSCFANSVQTKMPSQTPLHAASPILSTFAQRIGVTFKDKETFVDDLLGWYELEKNEITRSLFSLVLADELKKQGVFVCGVAIDKAAACKAVQRIVDRCNKLAAHKEVKFHQKKDERWLKKRYFLLFLGLGVTATFYFVYRMYAAKREQAATFRSAYESQVAAANQMGHEVRALQGASVAKENEIVQLQNVLQAKDRSIHTSEGEKKKILCSFRSTEKTCFDQERIIKNLRKLNKISIDVSERTNSINSEIVKDGRKNLEKLGELIEKAEKELNLSAQPELVTKEVQTQPAPAPQVAPVLMVAPAPAPQPQPQPRPAQYAPVPQASQPSGGSTREFVENLWEGGKMVAGLYGAAQDFRIQRANLETAENNAAASRENLLYSPLGPLAQVQRTVSNTQHNTYNTQSNTYNAQRNLALSRPAPQPVSRTVSRQVSRPAPVSSPPASFLGGSSLSRMKTDLGASFSRMRR